MSQDAFTLRLVAKELDGALKGGKINKINQPDREEISLLIYTGKRTVKLVINVNASDCGVYFANDDRENPLTAPNFCMLLRKHLSGAEILGVEMVGFERIVRIRMMCYSDFSVQERALVIEVMGKYSNALLIEGDTILGAAKTTSLDVNSRRVILAGAKYALPAPQDKVNPSDFSALAAVLKEPRDARFLFTRVSGIAASTAELIVSGYRSGDFARYVYDYIFSDEVYPCVLEREGVPVDFFARRVEGAKPFATLSEAQSYYYDEKRAKKHFEGDKRKLLSAIHTAQKKHEKRLSATLEKRKECEDCELLRIKGELLTANLWALERGMRACELANWYDPSGGTLKIALDPLLSPADNAQSYFKRYRKQKRTLEMLVPQEAETRAELEYLASLSALAEKAETLEDLKCLEEELLSAGLVKPPANPRKAAKKAPELPYRSYECGGFHVYAGRNNLQNDRLVRQSAPSDIWLHAQRYHSCHVVIRTEGKSVPPEVLQFAANVCARFSDGKGDKIAVDYCLIKFVKKPPKSKAGFVIYTDYKTLLGDPSI